MAASWTSELERALARLPEATRDMVVRHHVDGAAAC